MLSETDRSDIKRAFEQAMAQFQAPVKNWPAFVKSSYDEEAILMPPDAAAVWGHVAILAYLEAFPAFSDHKQESLELTGLGDLVCSRDVFSVTLAPAGLAPIRYTGKALTIWRKQAAGSWKMYREIWNSDRPPAA